jgi:hypothetical protein
MNRASTPVPPPALPEASAEPVPATLLAVYRLLHQVGQRALAEGQPPISASDGPFSRLLGDEPPLIAVGSLHSAADTGLGPASPHLPPEEKAARSPHLAATLQPRTAATPPTSEEGCRA